MTGIEDAAEILVLDGPLLDIVAIALHVILQLLNAKSATARVRSRSAVSYLLRRIVSPVHQAKPPARSVDVGGSLGRMAPDVTDDLAHMCVIVVCQLVLPLAEDPDDVPAAGVADAFVSGTVRTFPTDRVA